MHNDTRLEQLIAWLSSATPQQYSAPLPASADASFRRYFRVSGLSDHKTYIVMDAPPENEDCRAFVTITQLIRETGVNAPDIVAENIIDGFLLLSDLGQQPYLEKLNNDTVDKLYADAVTALLKMQTIQHNLPLYDDSKLLDEMELFQTWYLDKHLNIILDDNETTQLNNVFKHLINNASEQPAVFVHRDYHSRNLMYLDNQNPGVIDFQDAVIGPVTYDLVSLFKDCYIEWPRQRVITWLEAYLNLSNLDCELATFIRWFDLMGLQRHLKILGIFCRLHYRDHKPQYINDLPLTLKYVIDTCQRYDELKPLLNIFHLHVLNHSKVNNT